MLIKQADAEVLEEVKWRKPSSSILRVPVWGTRAERVFQARRSTVHLRRSDGGQRSQAVAQEGDRDPVGLQEHRETKGQTRAIEVGKPIGRYPLTCPVDYHRANDKT